MDPIPRPYPRTGVVADDDTVLPKVTTLWQRCMDTVERSRVCIERSEQRIAESDARMNGWTIRAEIAEQPLGRRVNRQALRERLCSTRVKSQLLMRQTRDIIARSRALLIEPL